MKTNKCLLLVFCCAVVLAFSHPVVGQEDGPAEWAQQMRQAANNPLIDAGVSVDGSRFLANYEHRTIEFIGRATGNRGINLAQKEVLAMSAARAMAQGKLAEYLYGVNVSGSTSVRDGDNARQSLLARLENQVVRNAKILSETTEPRADGSIMGIVRIGYLLDGPTGLTSFVVEQGLPQTMAADDDLFRPVSVPATPEEPYTGLIVDATGVNSIPALFPKILAQGDNRVIYSARVVNTPDVLVNGTVRYTNTVEKARQIKNDTGNNLFGNHPLVVTAREVVQRSSLVVSDEDAVKIFAEDVRSGFLRDGKVCFVLN